MNPIYNFSGRDYTARLEALLTLLGSEVPTYTDRNYADAGMALLRLVAREGDQLGFYLDNAFYEGFVNTVQFRQSLIDLGLLVGYLPTIYAAATTSLLLTRKDGVSGSISIPKYTAFGRSDGYTYLAMDDTTMASNEDIATVDAIQGQVVTEVFSTSQISIVDWSGHPRVALEAGVASGSVEVQYGSAPVVEYTEVDSFWRSLPADNHFLLELNGDTGEVWLVFGDGVKGTLPPQVNVDVRYVKTDGALGNGGTGTITTVPSELTASITCTNTEPATGGGDAENTESIRRMIPALTRTQRRGLTLPDYEALIGHEAGVSHVQAVDRGMGQQWPHLHVGLWVVPNGGGAMSTPLKAQLLAKCADWGHLGAWEKRYILQDAVEVAVDPVIRIGVSTGYPDNGVKAAVTSAVTSFFAAANQEVGGLLDYALLHQAISAVPGVSWVEIDSPTDDVVRAAGEINTAGSISVTVST